MQDALIRIAELAPTLGHAEVRALLELARQENTTGSPTVKISGRKLAAAANLSHSSTKAALASLNERQIIRSDSGGTATEGATHRLIFLETVPLERGPNFGPPLGLISAHPGPNFGPPLSLISAHPGPNFGTPRSPTNEAGARAHTFENSDPSISDEDQSTWRLLKAKPSDYDSAELAAARGWMASYKAKLGNWDGTEPDDKLCAEFLAIADITRLENLIYELQAERKKPGNSYAWFVTVAAQRLWKMPPDEFSERRQRLTKLLRERRQQPGQANERTASAGDLNSAIAAAAAAKAMR
jgi:hypothetical protein